jgi:hypothetical protein
MKTKPSDQAMSNTPRPPLLSDEAILNPDLIIPLGTKMVRDIYEAARAKDAELIQQLVDGLHFERMSLVSCMESQKALDAAAAAGFKPTEP